MVWPEILEGVSLRQVCLIIAAIATFIVVLLTIIHYASRVMVCIAMGVASDGGFFGGMMQEYWRDVLVPFLVALGSFLIFLVGHIYVLTVNWLLVNGYLT